MIHNNVFNNSILRNIAEERYKSKPYEIKSFHVLFVQS